MAGLMRVPRTRGALSGVLLMLLGAWGALIPFIGPYFDFSFTPRPDDSWYYTSDRLWLSILPGAAAFLGGLIVMASANRAMAIMGGWLAAAAGAWFVIGPNLTPLGDSMPDPGTAVGGSTRATLEVLTFFLALGAVIIFLAALALGRFAVVGVREIRQAEARAAEREEMARSDSAMDTTATGTTATGTTAGVADQRTGRDADAWTEPSTRGEGRHEATSTRAAPAPAAPAAQPAPPAQPMAAQPPASTSSSSDLPPMPPPAEGEKVGAGAGTGHEHHRRIFHRRHHDDDT